MQSVGCNPSDFRIARYLSRSKLNKLEEFRMYTTLIGAFLGAFFAFIFMRLNEVFNKIYERQKRNYNALVRFEYICCENLDNISNAIFVIDGFEKAIIAALQDNQLVIYGNKLHPLLFNESLLMDFVTIDFMNKVLSYQVDLHKINHDIETINEMYSTFKNAAIQKTIDLSTYLDNTKIALEKALQLKTFLEAFDEKTIDLLGCVRLLERKQKPILNHIFSLWLTKKVFTPEFKKNLEKQKQIIRKGRVEVMEESKKELDEIKKSIDKTRGE